MNSQPNGVTMTSVINNQLIFSNTVDDSQLFRLSREEFNIEDPYIKSLKDGIRCKTLDEVWHVDGNEASFNYVAKGHDANGNLVIGIFRNDLFLGRVQMKYEYYDRSPLPYNKAETNIRFTKNHTEFNSPFYKYGGFETLLNENIPDYDADLTYEYLLLIALSDAKESTTNVENKMIYISNPPDDMKVRIARIVRNITADNEDKIYVLNQTQMGKPGTTYILDPQKF